MKPCKRGRGLAVIGEREVEELVDRLGRLWSEPDQHALAHQLPSAPSSSEKNS